MKLIPVALALFYRQPEADLLEIWVQTRTDDGVYHGLLEFPGGGIEAGETPLLAAVREVEEEVGVNIDPTQGKFMGTYTNELPGRNILLYVFLFPDHFDLQARGEWLQIRRDSLSSPYLGKIPAPNHQIIDQLFLSLYDGEHE